MGLALGLALFTKATAYIFALPFCVYYGIELLRKIKGRAFYLGAFIGVIALLINAGHYSRMWLVYQSLLGPTKDYRNEIININVMSSNAIRNIALNFIPSHDDPGNQPEVNLYIRNWLQLLHKVTGLAPDDPRTSWPYSRTNVFDMVSTQRHEDNIGNPLHTGLTIFAIFILFVRFPYYQKQHFLPGYILCLSFAFGLYCLFFRWQEWGTRLLLPLVILWTPAITALLFMYREKWVSLVPLVLVYACILYIFQNPLRPIVPADFETLSRQNYAFNWNKPLFEVYNEISQTIAESDCNQVGLRIGSDTWEYPFWTLLKSYGFSGRIEHVQVKNPTSKFEDPEFHPCAIIIQAEEPEIYSNWGKYDFGDFNLYIKQ